MSEAFARRRQQDMASRERSTEPWETCGAGAGVARRAFAAPAGRAGLVPPACRPCRNRWCLPRPPRTSLGKHHAFTRASGAARKHGSLARRCKRRQSRTMVEHAVAAVAAHGHAGGAVPRAAPASEPCEGAATEALEAGRRPTRTKIAAGAWACQMACFAFWRAPGAVAARRLRVASAGGNARSTEEGGRRVRRTLRLSPTHCKACPDQFPDPVSTSQSMASRRGEYRLVRRHLLR
eukprot:132735-Chlamydomonas_euryale.AAC.5